jgi:Ca2+:H+ antiporter
MRVIIVAAVLIAASLGAHFGHAGPVITFVVGAGALIPLAAILGKATEEVAMRQGPAIGGLLNATFGNATELILAIMSIRAGGALLEMVKASITGSIIGNLLLVLGASIVAGGVRYKTMSINPRGAGMATSMMMLAVIGLVVPAVFARVKPEASSALLEQMSLAVAAILMLIYILGLIFSLGTHRHIFNPDDTSDETPEAPEWSMTRAVAVLLICTALVVVESDIVVDAVQELIEAFHLSPLFLGAVVIAIVGNAAEHAVAIMVARRGHMELAFQIACGSSTQVALFVAPFLVFCSLLMGRPLNLLFTIFEVLSIVVSVVIVAMISSDGETNWFEGAQLLGVYAILCVAFYAL